MEREDVDSTKEAAETAFQREGGRAESEPKINLKFYHAFHAKDRPADWKKLEELLPWADVYAVELVGWNERVKDIYNSVSQGTLSVDELPKSLPPIARRELELLYGSRKPVVFIDIPAGHPLMAMGEEWDSERKKSIHHFSLGNFEEAIAYRADVFKLRVEEYREREDYLRSQLESLVENLQESKTEDKNGINVLVRFGATHSLLSTGLGGAGARTSRAFQGSDTTLSFDGEAIRRLIYGKEIPEELVARSMVAEILAEKLWSFADTSSPILSVTRHIVSGLTLGDMKSISWSLGKGVDIVSAIEAVGIEVPESQEDFAAMVRGIKKKWGREVEG